MKTGKIRRLILFFAAVVSLIILTSSLHAAQSGASPITQRSSSLQLEVQPAVQFAGSDLAMKAEGFRPNESLSITLIDALGNKIDLGHEQTDANGVALMVLSSPSTATPGDYQVLINGTGSGAHLAGKLTVCG